MACGDRMCVGLACGIALLATGGCGESAGSAAAVAALRAEIPHVLTLHFVATTTLPGNPPPDVNVTVSNPAAQDACQATLALPSMPAGSYNCPADFGITYTLFFEGGDTEGVMIATLDPAGCQQGKIGDGSTSISFWTATSPDYWSRLAADLGVDESEIYP